MQINSNISRNNQSFTAFKLAGAAEITLKKTLKSSDWIEFNRLIDDQASNPVDIHLFGNKDDKFYAKVIANNEYIKDKTLYQYQFFESTIKFLKRTANKADAILEKLKEIPNVDKDMILNKIR